MVPHAPVGGSLAEPGRLGQSEGWGGFASSGHSAGAFNVGALIRQKWLVLGLFLFVSAATVPWIWLYMLPEFRASAVIRVRPVVSRIVFKTENNGLVPLYRSYLNTQVSVIRSPTVLRRVLDLEDIRQTSWYSQEPNRLTTLLRSPARPLERLGKALTVRPRRDTELIDVSLLALNAKDAKLIVDAVVKQYEIYSRETLRDEDVILLRTLFAEKESLGKDVAGQIATKFNLAKQLGTADPEQLRSQLSTQLATLETEGEQLEQILDMARWDLNRLTSDEQEAGDADEEGDADSGFDDPESRFVQDGEWRGLNKQLRTNRYVLRVARNQLGESHPRIKELEAGVDHAEQLLREREVQIVDHGPVALANTAVALGQPVTALGRLALEHDIERLEHKGKLLASRIDHQRDKVGGAGDMAKDLAHYDQEIATKQELYEAVRSRLSELEMEGKAPGRISVMALAVQPSQPYRDRRLLLSAMALAAAMMMSVGVAYVRTVTDQRIREARDVQHAVRVPFLGQLPSFEAASSPDGLGGELVMESVRMLRTALLERISQTDKRVILITSSTGGTGKTTVALQLARSLAQLGKRTLLVEADLRHPSISGRMQLESQIGLAEILTGTANDSAISHTGTANFDVLVAGAQFEDFDAELLANGVFAASLERWKQSYDYILVDSPPVLPVADARILAGQADGTIMVLRASHTRRPEVIQAYADLSAAGGTLLGTVLVGTDSSTGYSYYAGY
ncbi:MAG: polysaccharide biosynthesis tyrosine autokinase [Planctomycetes bacterium]|nr:polysaccharide biosynthesis tyrosine autokinase [Planctomycetota bacterium]